MEQLDPAKTSVSYDFADVEVILEVFRDMLVMAVLPGYKRDFKKYNLQRLAGQEEDKDEDGAEAKTVNVADLIKKRKEQQAQGAGNTNQAPE